MDLKNIGESIVFSDKTFTKRVLFADQNILCFVLNFKAGQSLPAHRHETSTLMLHVLGGKGTLRVNSETVALKAGDYLSVQGEDDFEVPAVAEDMTLLVSLSPNPSNALYAKSLG